MPLIDFFLPQNALLPAAKVQAVDQLTGAILRGEGPPDNPQTRSITWTHVHEFPTDALCVGGRPAEKPRYRVEITLPEGTGLYGPGPEPAAGRKALVREVTDIILAAEGTDFSHKDALRIWVLIREIRDGYWGAMGTTLSMEEIATFARSLSDGGPARRDALTSS